MTRYKLYEVTFVIICPVLLTFFVVLKFIKLIGVLIGVFSCDSVVRWSVQGRDREYGEECWEVCWRRRKEEGLWKEHLSIWRIWNHCLISVNILSLCFMCQWFFTFNIYKVLQMKLVLQVLQIKIHANCVASVSPVRTWSKPLTLRRPWSTTQSPRWMSSRISLTRHRWAYTPLYASFCGNTAEADIFVL